jgi:hypothetical protein
MLSLSSAISSAIGSPSSESAMTWATCAIAPRRAASTSARSAALSCSLDASSERMLMSSEFVRARSSAIASSRASGRTCGCSAYGGELGNCGNADGTENCAPEESPKSSRPLSGSDAPGAAKPGVPRRTAANPGEVLLR